jgi:hypothetical protein
MRNKTKTDKVTITATSTFSTPIYRVTEDGLIGPMTRTFRAGKRVKAVKFNEAGGNLHTNLGNGYVAFSVPAGAVKISR